MQRAIAALRTGIRGFNSPQSIRGHATRTGYLQQQQRNYVPSPAAQVAVCWNCQKQGRHMICADCGSLQDVDTSIVSKEDELCLVIAKVLVCFSAIELL